MLFTQTLLFNTIVHQIMKITNQTDDETVLSQPLQTTDSGALKKGILIIPPIGLGNFLMCLPSIEAIKAANPKSPIHLLALKKGISDLSKPINLFDRIHLWDPDSQGIFRGLKTIKDIRNQKLDLVIHLFPTKNPKYALFRSLLGIKNHSGFNYQYWGDKLNNHSIEVDKNIHDTHQNLNLINDYLIAQGQEPKSIDQQIIYNLPEACTKLSNENFLVCHPGSSAERLMNHKRMPPKDFAQLCDQIYNDFKIKTYLAGGPEELPLRAEVIEHLKTDCLIHFECKSLLELGYILKEAKFFLGNDSGLMHYANSLDTKTIVFFGPTDENRTGPWVSSKSPKALILRDNLECAPCWTLDNLGEIKPCIHSDYRCLTNIKLSDQYKKIKAFIKHQDA